MAFLVTSSAFGQMCANATHANYFTQFTMYEDQGDAYAFFRPTLAKTTLGFTWTSQSTLPSKWYLYMGNCGNFTTVYEGSFFADENNGLYFVFDSLLVGKDYYVRLEGNPGDDFSIQSYLTETIHASGTCTSVGCNVIQNPSFDEVEFGINVTNPVGGVLGPQNGAGYIDEACGWDFLKFAANQQNIVGCNSPDYYRTAQNSMYAPLLPCSSATAIGNSCANVVAPHSGQGVAQLVTADIRTNAPANRREYMHTQLNTPAGSTMPVQTGKIYYTSMWARPNTDRRLRNPALQFLVIDNATMQNNLPQNCQAILNWGTPMADFSTQLNSLNSNWQNPAQLVQYTGADADILVIGNFLSPAASDALNSEDVTNPWNQVPDSVPSWFIDDVEIIPMPDAGSDVTVCAGEPVTLGWQPSCLPSGVTYQWWDGLYSTVLATTANLTINAVAGANTYILQIYFQGQSIISTVTVTGLPGAPLSISPINQTICNGNLSFTITDYDPNNLNYTFTTTGLNGSGQIDGNGNLDFGSVEFTHPLGMATVTVTVTNPLSNCQNSQTFTVYDCCNAQPGGIPVYNERFSAFNQGTAGQSYIIYGSVLLDDNYVFTDCNFYLQPDAELVALSDLNIEFQNCTFQACNEFKWDRIFNEHASTSITFTDCQIGEALRAVHSENDAQLSLNGSLLFDNTLSQLARSYANGSALSWQTNTYNMYPLNSITQQHPLSTIPMGTILNLNGYSVVGIKFDEAQNFALANGNTFWSDWSSSFDNYLHVWLAQNSIGDISDNMFNEGMNVRLEQASTTTVTNNNFQKSAQPNGAPGGIFAFESSVYIGQTGASFSNYFLDGAGIACVNPNQTTILNNYIDQAAAFAAIQVLANATGSPPSTNSSFVKIQENEIHGFKGIYIANIVSNWQGYSLANQPGNRVLVNYNTLFVDAVTNPNNSAPADFGIHAQGSHGISISENTIEFNYPNPAYIPKKFSPATKACGIIIDGSRNAWVGCNTITYAGKGLDLRGDVTKDTWNSYAPTSSSPGGYPLNFQTNTFASCFYGIYIDQFSTISDFGEQALAADNIYTAIIGAPVNTLLRLKDARNGGSLRNYFYSGSIGGNTYVANNGSVSSAPIANSNNCGVVPPPNNKQTQESANVSTLKVYPNPANDWLNYLITNADEENGTYQVEIFDVNGRVVYADKSELSEGVIDVSKLASGMYMLRIRNENSVYVQRFARF